MEKEACKTVNQRKGKTAKDKSRLKSFGELLREEEGMGTVEVILILVVLVGLVIIFKNQLTSIVNSLFQKITSQTNTI